MTHRIVSSTYPERIIGHIRACGTICRTETTNYRGPLAIIGGGRVWAVAELIKVKPATQGKPCKDGTPAPQGYLWCFEELREVEAIPCANAAAPAMFQNGSEWEPLFLQASAQALLNALLSPESGPEAPQMASGVSTYLEGSGAGIGEFSRNWRANGVVLMNQENQLSMFEDVAPAIRLPVAEIPVKRWEYETPASSEGRDFLKLITEVEPEVIDNNYPPYAIEAWLEEMGYEWNGGSWVFNGSGEG